MRSHGAGEHGIDVVRLGWDGVHHVEEVLGVAKIVARIHERLADGIFIGPGGDSRHLGDQAEGADAAVVRVRDVQAVVIEGRERADDAADDRHRMRIAPEAVVELAKLLVNHGVQQHAAFELGELGRVGQLPVQQ